MNYRTYPKRYFLLAISMGFLGLLFGTKALANDAAYPLCPEKQSVLSIALPSPLGDGKITQPSGRGAIISAPIAPSQVHSYSVQSGAIGALSGALLSEEGLGAVFPIRIESPRNAEMGRLLQEFSSNNILSRVSIRNMLLNGWQEGSQTRSSISDIFRIRAQRTGLKLSDVEYTIPGSPTTPIAPNLPLEGNGRPLILSESPLVGKCYLVASQDKSFDSETVAFNPDAFRSVGVLITDDDVCSMSIIDKEWVLTAAHCLILPSKFVGSPIKAKRFTASTLKAFVPKTLEDRVRYCNGPSLTLSMCFDKIVLDPNRIEFFKDATYGENGTVKFDVALIKIGEGVKLPSGLRFPRLDFKSPIGPYITIAGFGSTSSKSLREQLDVQIGWGIVYSLDNSLITYKNSKNHGMHCFGDSGGPVFNDAVFGYPQDEYTQIGIISQIYSPSSLGETLAACQAPNTIGAIFRLNSVQEWMCSIAKSIKGC